MACFWSGNDACLEGTVTAFDKSVCAHRVTYDDGENQWLQLWRENEVVRWSETDEERAATREKTEKAGTLTETGTVTGTVTGTPAEKNPEGASKDRRRSFLVSEALAAAEAKEAAAFAAARNVARKIKAEAPDAKLVSCKKKLGVFVSVASGKKESSRRDDSADLTDQVDKKYHITCLCASCVSVGANAFDPRRWEAHCGAGHTKKWKSTVRVELDDARVFECAGADANAAARPHGRARGPQLLRVR